MKKIKIMFAVALCIFMLAGCAYGTDSETENKEIQKTEFSFITDDMEKVNDTSVTETINGKMKYIVMSLYSDWSINDEKPGITGLAFRDATQKAYYDEYGKNMWDEEMYAPVEEYIKQSEKFWAFSDEQVRRIVTEGKGVYDRETDKAMAADGYGHSFVYKLKEVWKDGETYLIVYNYGRHDFELPENTVYYQGMIYAVENENGEIIFLANKNDINKEQ
ncbi:MAG: hypothetical protein IJD80_05685 [Oscillospiraceae bacterium]|nr:hypothetical protein [Oscillospiraceae bacterium]